jgi:hypothetical protein
MGMLPKLYQRKAENDRYRNIRKLLRELSIESLKKSLEDSFWSERIQGRIWVQQGGEEGCYDVAIYEITLGTLLYPRA